MKQLLTLIKEKKSVGILLDQRDKTGEVFPFFGKDAQTSTAIQRLSIKYKFPIIPVLCLRNEKEPNKFIVTSFPPLEMGSGGNGEEEIRSLTLKTLELLEEWVREYPQQWMLWSYSRWKSQY